MVTPMRMKPRVLRLVALLATQAACALDTPQQYLVSDLRILAVLDETLTATPAADVAPGEPFKLEALVANPSGSPATLDWYACLPPPVGPYPPPCLDEERLRDPAAFVTNPGVFHVGTGAAVVLDPLATVNPLDPTLVAAMGLAVDATLQIASTTPSLQCQQNPALPVVAIARSGGAVKMALKRVQINPTARLPAYSSLPDAYRINGNPAVAGITLNPANAGDCTGGSELLDGALLPPGKIRLCGVPDAASPEAFQQCQSVGDPLSVKEDLEWQWYVTAGEIDGARFDGNATGRDIALTPPAGQTFTLWVIVRDGRGGSGWATFTLTAP